MITNSSVTIYHKGIDSQTRLETWTKKVYDRVWFFGGKGAGLNKGYDNANDVQIRIPYFEGLKFEDLSIGDIIVQGSLDIDIETQQDLDGYLTYNITSLNNNNFGNNPHINIGGK